MLVVSAMLISEMIAIMFLALAKEQVNRNATLYILFLFFSLLFAVAPLVVWVFFRDWL